MHGRISDPGRGLYPPRLALALRTPGWGFHTVRGGIDPGERRFHLQFVGFVDEWNVFVSGEGLLSFQGGAGSENSGLGFPHFAERYLSGGLSFSSLWFAGVVDIWKDF